MSPKWGGLPNCGDRASQGESSCLSISDKPWLRDLGAISCGERDPRGGSHQRMQQQTGRVDRDMAFLALDQLARIKAVWVDATAPFSAFFTLWLSITQAVGLASRPACSRHLT